MRVAIVLAGLLSLVGCISGPNGETPAWFADAQAEDPGTYPSLREVPRGTSANTDAAHWAQVESELTAVANDVRSNERAQPATATETPEQFLEEARRELEETRQAHPDE